MTSPTDGAFGKNPNVLQSKVLKRIYIGDNVGDFYRGEKGDARSLDYSSNHDL